MCGCDSHVSRRVACWQSRARSGDNGRHVLRGGRIQTATVEVSDGWSVRVDARADVCVPPDAVDCVAIIREEGDGRCIGNPNGGSSRSGACCRLLGSVLLCIVAHARRVAGVQTGPTSVWQIQQFKLFLGAMCFSSIGYFIPFVHLVRDRRATCLAGWLYPCARAQWLHGIACSRAQTQYAIDSGISLDAASFLVSVIGDRGRAAGARAFVTLLAHDCRHREHLRPSCFWGSCRSGMGRRAGGGRGKAVSLVRVRTDC